MSFVSYVYLISNNQGVAYIVNLLAYMTANLMPVRHMYERVILLYKKDTAIVMFGTSILHKSLRNIDNYNITPNFNEKLKHQVHIVRTHCITSCLLHFFRN